MRLDKFITGSTSHSRSQIKRCIGKGQVTVNGKTTTDPSLPVSKDTIVTLNDHKIDCARPRYIMLNKPEGYICSTEDEFHPGVLQLIDIENRDKLHIAGRLDVDTTGLVLITDDGQWSHRITSPKKHCRKVYQATLAEPIKKEAIAIFKKGILLKNEERCTLPAELLIHDDHHVQLTIEEGKYHQVKRMFAATGNKVTALHRIKIGNIALDQSLQPGEWRYLATSEATL
ncbi:MAG: 16S rRNA pseudouridine(516) synthase [Gammaproteobacteria bacterium]|nr:MAG: 16S rRNA pseudouridine(516) synthase [Pseudomonadota bacterium]PIE38894.1 MAG: 16S rRNA pseudouridine(516) synthase [Gammaproteobacteria bacterium]